MITSTNGPIIIDSCACVCEPLGKMKIFTRLRVCAEHFCGGGSDEPPTVHSYHSLINMTTDGMIKKWALIKIVPGNIVY